MASSRINPKTNSKMIHKILVYSVILLVFSQNSFAQKSDDPRVKKISKTYFTLQEDIKAGRYYQNQFKINANNLKQHLGLESFEDKYHTLDEKFIYELDKNGKPTLKNVHVITNLSIDESVTIEYKADFMFDKKGRLIYHLQSQKYSEDQDFYRTQFFYEKEKVIQLHIQVDIVSEDALTEEHKARAKDVQKEAKYYWDKFYQKHLPDMEALMDF